MGSLLTTVPRRKSKMLSCVLITSLHSFKNQNCYEVTRHFSPPPPPTPPQGPKTRKFMRRSNPPPPTSGQIKHVTASKSIRRPVIPKLFAESSAVSLPLPFFFSRCGPSTEAMNVSRIRYTAGGSGWDMPQGARRVGRRRHLETIHHAKLSKFREMDKQTIPLIDAAPSGTAS
jgi:hypothetical protein